MMDDSPSRQDPLERFRKAVATATRNTQHMMDKLDTFERRFATLNDNMAPIQRVNALRLFEPHV